MAGTEPFLVTEAVRGEGAYLLNDAGERFMLDIHPLAELAPRDVVARGIQNAMAVGNTDHVWLDLRHLPDELVYERFPTIVNELKGRGLDLANDLIPVAPAAHYFIGGIAAATDGRTSLPGLLALGEAACTGVHGANRLASNSLLEGLVFGTDAAALLTELGQPAAGRSVEDRPARISRRNIEAGDRAAIDAAVEAIQRAMSQHVAVVRSADGLRAAAAEVAAQRCSAGGCRRKRSDRRRSPQHCRSRRQRDRCRALPRREPGRALPRRLPAHRSGARRPSFAAVARSER